MSKPNVLLITYTHAEYIGTVADHVNGLLSIPDANVVKVDCSWAEYVEFNCFDVVMLHYSLVIAMEAYISRKLHEKIAAFPGLKVLFIQDEYRWIDATAAAIRDLKIGVVFSVVHPSEVRNVYRHDFLDGVEFEYTLTGFVPEHLADVAVPRYEDRRIDIGYRARRLPGWYGRHAEQKYLIADKFMSDPRVEGLKLDIATDEASRIYGKAWIQFMSNCKAVLGTESGASVCDFTGEIKKSVEQHIALDPSVTDDELRRLYFANIDGKVVISAISPRVFEAAALRTLMIMYPGKYSDVLEPGKHFVELRPDHSNIDEVLAILRSPERAAPIIEAAYQDIVRSGRWGHKAFAEHVSRVIRRHVPAGGGIQIPYTQLRWYMMLARLRSLPKNLVLRGAPLANRMARNVFLTTSSLPAPLRKMVEPVLRLMWRKAMKTARAIVLRRQL